MINIQGRRGMVSFQKASRLLRIQHKRNDILSRRKIKTRTVDLPTYIESPFMKTKMRFHFVLQM